MKKNYPSLTLMICTILAFCFSCKKDSTPTTITPLTPAPISATGTVVEYQITNMNNRSEERRVGKEC